MDMSQYRGLAPHPDWSFIPEEKQEPEDDDDDADDGEEEDDQTLEFCPYGFVLLECKDFSFLYFLFDLVYQYV